MLKGLIDVRDVPKLFRELDMKIIQHLMLCKRCGPFVRCTGYLRLKMEQDGLKIESGNISDQAN